MPPTLTQFDLSGWAVPNLNLLDVKMVPYVKENKLILDISLICVSSFRILLQLIVYSVFVMFVVFLNGALSY